MLDKTKDKERTKEPLHLG